MSFDAFGARRDAINWQDMSSSIITAGFGVFTNPVTTRGFTGHEMADEVGIIHMNGRIYDPKLARFLQADPFVQSPTDTQMLNRYSYVRNNPLNATDPSGYFVFTLGAIALAAGGAVEGVLAVGLLFGAAGFADALVQGASFGQALKAGFVSGLSAAAFSYIGQQFNVSGANNLDGAGLSRGGNLLTKTGDKLFKFGKNYLTSGQVAGQIGLHSLTGGVFNVLGGGKFGHGFASAGLVKSFTPILEGVKFLEVGNASIAQVAVAAIVGGTMSKISGGKFANGAITGAFQNLLNQQNWKGQRDCMGRCHGNENTVGRDMTLEEQRLLYSGAAIVVTLPASSGLALLTTTGKVIQLSYQGQQIAKTIGLATQAKTMQTARKAQVLVTDAAVTSVAVTAPVITNPQFQQNVVDFSSGLVVDGPPPPTPAGVAGAAVRSFVIDELSELNRK